MIDFQKISEEYIKCYSDKSRIYMICNYLRTLCGSKEVPFHLFPRQQMLCKALGDSNNSVVTSKSRQAGLSTVISAYIACETILADRSTPRNTLIVADTLQHAQQMYNKVLKFLMQFPLWMWGNAEEFLNMGYDITKPPEKSNIIFEKCTQKEMILMNGCEIYARSSDPNASRGLTIHLMVFDEVAFIENAKEVYGAALPTISTTNGRVVFISTPCGHDALYYPTVKNAKLKGTDEWNGFDLVEMKWYQDPRYNRFLEWTRRNAETGDIDIVKETTLDNDGNIEYNEEKWETMIKEGWKPRSPWYISMCRQYNNDPQKIAQELDASFLGSDSTVVGPEYIDMQRQLNVREPNTEFKDILLEDMWIWKKPVEGHRYIMAVDNSRGSADDATALEIIDMDGIEEDGTPCIEQVAEYNGKMTGDAVGELAYSYGILYNQAHIVVEDIGGYGSATLLCLMNMKYPNLYYDDPSLKKYTSQNEATTMQVSDDGLPGFHSSSVRFQMLSNFANLVKTNQFKIRSKRVLAELETWIFKNGRIDHKDGCHDDTLTCLSMGLFVMAFSINRRNELKEKDKVILNAMVNVNNRMVTNVSTPSTSDKTIPQSLLITTSGQPKANKYAAYQWLFS